MPHNHLGMGCISYFFTPNNLVIQKRSVSASDTQSFTNGAYKVSSLLQMIHNYSEVSVSVSSLLRMTHNHSKMGCDSFFFAPNDSQSFRHESHQFLVCSKRLTIIQRISFFFAPNDVKSFRNRLHQFLLCSK